MYTSWFEFDAVEHWIIRRGMLFSIPESFFNTLGRPVSHNRCLLESVEAKELPEPHADPYGEHVDH